MRDPVGPYCYFDRKQVVAVFKAGVMSISGFSKD